MITLDGPPFRTRRGVAYRKNSPAEDFRDIRALVWPGDSRTLMGMRRSGALEASAGAVDPKALSDVMGNTIAQSRALQRIDTPAQTASTVPEARKRGRRARSANERRSSFRTVPATESELARTDAGTKETSI